MKVKIPPLKEGGIWIVAAELRGQGQNVQRPEQTKTKHMDQVCAKRKTPRRVGIVSSPVFTCSLLPSAVVMDLHLVAVT